MLPDSNLCLRFSVGTHTLSHTHFFSLSLSLSLPDCYVNYYLIYVCPRYVNWEPPLWDDPAVVVRGRKNTRKDGSKSVWTLSKHSPQKWVASFPSTQNYFRSKWGDRNICFRDVIGDSGFPPFAFSFFPSWPPPQQKNQWRYCFGGSDVFKKGIFDRRTR